MSWWNYKEVAEKLQTDYHVFLPILDGHAGCDRQYTTIENNALVIYTPKLDTFGGAYQSLLFLFIFLSHKALFYAVYDVSPMAF